MPSPADATPAWLYRTDWPEPGGELVLSADDAHYVARVCRASPGEWLSATDGRGRVAKLELLSVRGEVRVRVAQVTIAEDPGFSALACGAPEATRADWLFEKLAELGVRVVQPLDTARERWERFPAREDRWARLAVAALRQSRRAWLLEIRRPRDVESWLEGPIDPGERWLADVDGEAPAGLGAASAGWGVVGPSSGFVGPERDALRLAGFRPVRLASARLRTETAAVAWAALWGAARLSKTVGSRDSTSS